jgi:phosphoribosyl 1,2-cyclic phosphate phosphodiesterase
MKIKYLGTAAAEGIPAVFCKCKVCMEAKKRKGKDIRTRSQAVIDGRLLIDFPPDSYAHYLKGGTDLPEIRHLFVTHSHMDHFFPAELALRKTVFIASTPIEILHIYGNRTVEALVKGFEKKEEDSTFNTFHYMPPFKSVELNGYNVTSILARHDPKEDCLNYIVQHEGKTLLYAHDTGIFPDVTWDYLAKAKICFDLVSLDCTAMTRKDGSGHMGLQENIEVRHRLFDIGAADKKTLFVVNHFSHNGGSNHRELSRATRKEGFIAAWDGMEIKV